MIGRIDEITGCRQKKNGNMLAGRGVRRNTILVMMKVSWETMHGIEIMHLM